MTGRGAAILEIPATDYHADKVADRPTLSASIAKVLVEKSALHAWHQHPRLNPAYRRDDDQKYAIGTVAHALLLEGRDAVGVVDAADWRTKDAKALRDAHRAAGKVPLLAHQWDDVEQMVAAAQQQLAACNAIPRPFTGGVAEQTLVWEEDGVLCRALIDWLHDGAVAVSDYKTTWASAHPEAWSRRTMYTIGGDVQIAFHLRGIRKVFGVDAVWRYVVQECFPPYALTVIQPGPAVIALGNDKVERAIKTWRDCLTTGRWPGYPATVHRAELPAWEEARWIEREEAEAA